MPAVIMLIFEVFLVVAAFSLLWWGFVKLNIPEPMKTVLLVVLGLLGLWLVWSFVSGAQFPIRR